MEELDAREEEDQVSKYRDFDAASFFDRPLKIGDIEIRSHHTPIQVEKRQRRQNHNESHAFRQLPARPFQLPRQDHHEQKGNRQPRANSAGNKQRQRRGRDGRVGCETEIGVEVHRL